MEEQLRKMQKIVQHEILLQKNLMIQGLVGVNEVRASSQLSR